jgi:hypothetical protein
LLTSSETTVATDIILAFYLVPKLPLENAVISKAQLCRITLAFPGIDYRFLFW